MLQNNHFKPLKCIPDDITMEIEVEKKFKVPQCYVVVRKLTMEEISRMSLNPLYVVHKCGKCKHKLHYGPQCSTCKLFYHRKCALVRKTCCEKRIFTQGKHLQRSTCPKCKSSVEFGPQCSICKAKYHHYCVSQFEQCCQLNLCERQRVPSKCGTCAHLVDIGPKCPLCRAVYHVECIGEVMQCCGVRFTRDDRSNYKCVKCQRKLGLGAPMCSFCGSMMHGYCMRSYSTNCCSKGLSLEVYFIPNFKFVIKYYMQFDKRRAALKKVRETAVAHGHKLRSKGRVSPIERAKKKSVSSQTAALDMSATQTNVLDNIIIVDVKTELEQKELDIVDSPPVLEREDLVLTPELSPSSSVMPDNGDSEDTLKNLFDFLYNMVKKFPPPLQTQVKIDLFKTVTEAEMKWQCNMVQNNFL